MKKTATLTITSEEGKINLTIERGDGDHNKGDNEAFMVGCAMMQWFARKMREDNGIEAEMEVEL